MEQEPGETDQESAVLKISAQSDSSNKPVEQLEGSVHAAHQFPIDSDSHTDDLKPDIPTEESTPFIAKAENNGTNGQTSTLQNAANITSSLASFRGDVYQATTTPIPKGERSSGCCSCASTGICTFMKLRCYMCCKPVMVKSHPKPGSNAKLCERLKYSLLCPPHGWLARMLVIVLSMLFAFGLVWGATGVDGVYGGSNFGLLVLFLLCSAAGRLMPLIRLPPLLGMLIMGCILGNVPYIDVARSIDHEISAALRKIALAVILTRAGLGLDPKALKRMSGVVVRLAFLPCLVEAVTCMVTAHLFLKFPLQWGLMLGFVLAAVSPAVVVPSLLSLSDKGYGTDQGIPTLVIAAASLDDVLAISAFSILLSICLSSSENIALTVVRGPLEALAGVVYGIVLGAVLWYLPPHRKTHSLGLKRSALLLAGGLFALFGSETAGIGGAGALGCLTLPFVAALRWRKQLPDGQSELISEKHMTALWGIAQPFLFGLIGAAVDFTQITPSVVGWGILLLVIGLIFRLLASFLAVFGAGFTLKEKFFIPIAWLPKATVQALIGSLALDTAIRNQAGAEKVEWGLQILTIAVLCILLTAPIGAAAISLSGPRLLQKSAASANVTRESVSDQVDVASEFEMEIIDDKRESV